MCEVQDRQKELDAYEAIVVVIASRIKGTAFYEYHKAFAARSAALILQHNIKLDWGSETMGYFAHYSWDRLLKCVRCAVVWPSSVVSAPCWLMQILHQWGEMCFEVP
ncbi:hypothetical protein NP493_1121g00004 [Ridgeia piscesae]|uniref:Uncharacterized protein n=1 Tax=Ridgeia piscesae TaxID=27915 RepID=A0AAD9KGR9_RIDPI|nr:hypothetical protein NP493_1121g00004 [Ridgeia piscesae]